MLQLPYSTHQRHVWTQTSRKGHSHRCSYTHMTIDLWGFHVSLQKDAEMGFTEKSMLLLIWTASTLTALCLWSKKPLSNSFTDLSLFQLKYICRHNLEVSDELSKGQVLQDLREVHLLSSVPLVLLHFRFAQAGHLIKLSPQPMQHRTNPG